MHHIQVLCVGKLKEPFYRQAAAEYEKRLAPFCRLSLEELPEERLPENPSQAQVAQALQREGEALHRRIQKGALVIALCIEGKPCSSQAFSEVFSLPDSSQLTFLIGSSNGLHESVKAAAQKHLSLSEMTFPHHLARVMLLEQIYRAFQILNGSKYHK